MDIRGYRITILLSTDPGRLSNGGLRGDARISSGRGTRRDFIGGLGADRTGKVRNPVVRRKGGSMGETIRNRGAFVGKWKPSSMETR